MQTALFSSAPSRQNFDLPDADISLEPSFLTPTGADAALLTLHTCIPWRQDQIRIYGRTVDVPRLNQWFGEPGAAYTWSGNRMEPLPMPPPLSELHRRVEAATGSRFNSVLANLYRDGADTVGWHADDEPELGEEPFIASLSLGAERTFRLRHRTRTELAPVNIELPHGSLLCMGGRTQACWLHSLPPRARVAAPRINLTFRWVNQRRR